MKRPSAASSRATRPRRGPPEETRERLVQAAAEVFNRDGYDGTDSNRIAREAGYAPGTFYKHFLNKKEVFLAVYEDWVAREFREVGATLAEAGTADERAQRIVDIFVAHHRRWRGFRASLRGLVASDAEVQDFYRAQRRKQLTWMEELRRQTGGPPTSREEDAMLLFTLERTADALVDGEADALKLEATALRALLFQMVRAKLKP